MKESPGSFPLFPRCFVCGSENPKGLHTRFMPKDDGVEATFRPDETHLGYEDAVHGGIIGALIDEAIIWACYASTGRYGVTAELKIRYLKPMTLGHPYCVKGRMVEDRKRMWIATGVISDENGDILAKGEGRVIPQKGYGK